MVKLRRSRTVRRFNRLFFKWFLIAIIVWFIIFNAYAFHYKLDQFLISNKIKNRDHNGINLIQQKMIDDNFLSVIKTNITNRRMVQNEKIDNFSKTIQNINFKNLINCESIIEIDLNELSKAKKLIKELNLQKKILPDSNYIFDSKYCPQFRQIRGYDKHPIKESEYEFPLAFSILIYYNIEQFERLLRLIYRPHNVYCIHVDAKSTKEVHKAIESIVKCFDNVFIASKLENIIYAGISRLKADINCMHDLLNFKHNYTYNYNKTIPNWKYFINLASTEFPLRTNYELTEILRLFNGANDIEVLHNLPIDRVKYSWLPKYEKNTIQLVKTTSLKSPVPYNFTIAKGIAFGLFSFKFVEFVLNDKHAKELLVWAEDTYSPDEW